MFLLDVKVLLAMSHGFHNVQAAEPYGPAHIGTHKLIYMSTDAPKVKRRG